MEKYIQNVKLTQDKATYNLTKKIIPPLCLLSPLSQRTHNLDYWITIVSGTHARGSYRFFIIMMLWALTKSYMHTMSASRPYGKSREKKKSINIR